MKSTKIDSIKLQDGLIYKTVLGNKEIFLKQENDKLFYSTDRVNYTEVVTKGDLDNISSTGVKMENGTTLEETITRVDSDINDLDETKADASTTPIIIDLGIKDLTINSSFAIDIPNIIDDLDYILKVMDNVTGRIRFFARVNSTNDKSIIDFVETDKSKNDKEPCLCELSINTTTQKANYSEVLLQQRLSKVDLDNIASIPSKATVDEVNSVCNTPSNTSIDNLFQKENLVNGRNDIPITNNGILYIDLITSSTQGIYITRNNLSKQIIIPAPIFYDNKELTANIPVSKGDVINLNINNKNLISKLIVNLILSKEV